ncbi:MAG: hypothetical protein HYY67_09290 [Thaumarchaeota archaeon]|nr:hypothetical protein [Nitrososphaerota archaeon]
MVRIDTSASLESFRRFLINSTCYTFIPDSYLDDDEVFPEKEGETGSIYVEAADLVTLKKIRDISFVNARDVLGIIYTSRSGNTKLKWRQVRGRMGKVTGEASANSLVNLITAGVISEEYAQKLAASAASETAETAEKAPEVAEADDSDAEQEEMAQKEPDF